MADWGRALAGFVQGSSNVALQNITAQQEEERAERKARLLARLQVETQKEVAEFERQMALKTADKNFSGAEGDKFVYRNMEGKALSDRALSEDEKYAIGKDKREFNYRAEQDRLANARADAQLADQRARTGLMGAELKLKSAGAAGGTSGGKVGVGEIAEALIANNKDVIESADKVGMSPEIIKRLAYNVSARSLARNNTDMYSIQDTFLKSVQIMREGGTDQEASREESPRFSLDRFRAGQQKK